MTTPASAAIIAASKDPDLYDRAVALAASLPEGQRMTAAQVERARTRLAVAPVDDTGSNTVASVYEYATAQPRYRAGQDPAGVTDAHLLHALRQIAAEDGTE